MKVRALPRDPGPAAWNLLLDPPGPVEPISGLQEADWLVIGAGFAGLAAARRLSLNCPGDRITVLEARRVADGPAGRNSGFMIDLPHDLASEDYGSASVDHDRAQTLANRAAIAFAAETAAAFGLGREAFDPCGKVNGAATGRGDRLNRQYAAHLQALREPFEMLDADRMEAMTGTTYYRSGLYTPGTVILQPAAFVRGLARGLRSNRVRIAEESPVTGLTRDGGVWRAETPVGEVRAPNVILAVNGHVQSFGHFAGRLMHVFTYASMTAPLTAAQTARLGGERSWGITPADPLGTTVRRIVSADGDRIVVRNRFTFDPSMEVPEERLTRIARDHDAAFAARFPMLGDAQMQHRWGGRLCLSLNGVSAFGQLDEGLWSACCQNGLGTVRGTLSGMLAADLASGQDNSHMDFLLNADAPRRLPPGPVARVGATARLRWGEWRAGAEF